MSTFELFKLCLLKYNELKKEGYKGKWFYRSFNRFILIDLTEAPAYFFNSHIVDNRTIYSFMIEHDITQPDYMEVYKRKDVVKVNIRYNNNSIRFSGVHGMSAFLDIENLVRIPLAAMLEGESDNWVFWKTLFNKY